MPIYEYQCVDCGTVTDIKHAYKEPMNDVCASCGGALKRLFHAAGIVFKGSGFYVTDSRKSSASSSDKSSGDKGANASSGDKSGGEKSEKTGGDKAAGASTGAGSSGESASGGKSSPESPAAAQSEGAAKGSGGKNDAAA